MAVKLIKAATHMHVKTWGEVKSIVASGGIVAVSVSSEQSAEKRRNGWKFRAEMYTRVHRVDPRITGSMETHGFVLIGDDNMKAAEYDDESMAALFPKSAKYAEIHGIGRIVELLNCLKKDGVAVCFHVVAMPERTGENAKVVVSYRSHEIVLSARLDRQGVRFPFSDDGSLHNAFVISVNVGPRSIAFDFYTSVKNYLHGERHMDRMDVLNAFSCFVSDAHCGSLSFEDFCSELGYDQDSRRAEKVHKACEESFVKYEKLGLGDVCDLLNWMSEWENEDYKDTEVQEEPVDNMALAVSLLGKIVKLKPGGKRYQWIEEQMNKSASFSETELMQEYHVQSVEADGEIKICGEGNHIIFGGIDPTEVELVKA